MNIAGSRESSAENVGFGDNFTYAYRYPAVFSAAAQNQDPSVLAEFRELAQVGFCGKMGIEIQRLSAAGALATMPVQGNTQPLGLLHGGASAALAETLFSACALLHARELYGAHAAALGTNLHVIHHKGARDGLVRAVACSLYLGGSTASYLVEIYDERDQLLCTATGTARILPGKPPTSPS